MAARKSAVAEPEVQPLAGFRIDVPKNALLPALKAAASMASPRTSISVLKAILIDSRDGLLTLTGCDGESWLVEQVAAFTDGSGAICVNAMNLVQTVERMPEGDVSIEVDALTRGATVKGGRVSAKLQSLDPEDYPSMPHPPEDAKTLKAPVSVLRQAIDSVGFAAAADTNRPMLTGVHIDSKDGSLRFVATNTHQLAVKVVAIDDAPEFVATMPMRVCDAILAMGDSDDILEVTFDERRIVVKHGTRTIASQFLSGTYPSWERVVPTESTRHWKLEVDRVVEALGRVLPFAKNSANRARISAQDNEAVFRARAEEMGDIEDAVQMVATGADSFEFAVNCVYLKQAASKISGTILQLEMTENSRPIIVRGESDDYFCVIMPMALA